MNAMQSEVFQSQSLSGRRRGEIFAEQIQLLTNRKREEAFASKCRNFSIDVISLL